MRDEESNSKPLVKTFNNNIKSTSKLLGVSWDNRTDEFIFDFTELVDHGKNFHHVKDLYSSLQQEFLIHWGFKSACNSSQDHVSTVVC